MRSHGRSATPRPHTMRSVPADERQATLLACWERALGRPANARDATFFALGGDSLLATRPLAQLRERLGVRVGMAAFYRQPTLAGLAAQLDEAAPAEPPLACCGRCAGCDDRGGACCELR